VWSGFASRTAVENNQAVAAPVGKIAQQVQINVGKLGTAVAKANQANADSENLKMNFVGMYQTQWTGEVKVPQISG
jgi:hypothetical protein